MIDSDTIINFFNLSSTYTEHFATKYNSIISVISFSLYTSAKPNKKNQ
jgi:hypothetical protein